MQKKAVFLDRDGTIIIDKIYLNDVNEIEYLPNVFESFRLLRDAGFVFLIATNQSGIPRGLVQLSNLFAIHNKIKSDFSLHGIDILNFYDAPFMTDTDHPMRKPNPGMILRGASDYNIDLSKSWMVGDRMTDVEAGHRAGVKTILLGDRENPTDFEFKAPNSHVHSLIEMSKFILKHS